MISVIMPSYLGEYPGLSVNAEQKFVRAVKSFLTQTYKDKELIIISDDCDITERIYEMNFKKFPNIKYIRIDKQPLYGGEVRNAGIDIAKGDIITYLDNDDVIGKKHLETIVNNFEYVEPRYGSIGTSSISHRPVDDIRWDDGYGHDYIFISRFIFNGYKFSKVKTPQYLVCHYKDGDF